MRLPLFAATSGFVAIALGCGSPVITSGPTTISEAFEWAGLTEPTDATSVQYAGENGIDHIVWLQFQRPGTAADQADILGCDLLPVERVRDNPFRRERESDPQWWVNDAVEGSLFCKTEPSGGDSLYRSIRVDPCPDGVRVQVIANSQ